MAANDLPPEILASIFEIGILTKGISFLTPVSRVCRHWHDVVRTTPRLWGIIDFHSTKIETIERQLDRAKAAPLTIYNQLQWRGYDLIRVEKRLVSLANNWVKARVSANVLTQHSWADMVNLEELSLSYRAGASPEAFFRADSPPLHHSKFRSFSANSLPREWIVPFLVPTLHHFRLVRGHTKRTSFQRVCDDVATTFSYLSHIPDVVSIELEDLAHAESQNVPSSLDFPSLTHLALKDVRFTPTLLNLIAAPRLLDLSINGLNKMYRPWYVTQNQDNDPLDHSLAPFFAQWSQPRFLPTHLQTLSLINVLQLDNIPYLVRWLRLLPNLVDLTIEEEYLDMSDAAGYYDEEDDSDTNLCRALAIPRPSIDGGPPVWCAPRLAILTLGIEGIRFEDHLLIAQSRGAKGFDDSSPRPTAPLRRYTSLICEGRNNEVQETLQQFVDQAGCTCLGCIFRLAMDD